MREADTKQVLVRGPRDRAVYLGMNEWNQHWISLFEPGQFPSYDFPGNIGMLAPERHAPSLNQECEVASRGPCPSLDFYIVFEHREKCSLARHAHTLRIKSRFSPCKQQAPDGARRFRR